MGDVTQKAQRQQQEQTSIIGAIIGLPFQFVGVMFGSLLAAVLVEWACLYFFWPDAGWRHAQHMLDYELSWLSEGFLRSVIVQEPGRTASWLVQLVYQWLVVKTGLLEWLGGVHNVAQSGPRSGFDMRYLAAQGVTTIQNYGLAALYTVFTFCVRMVVLTLTLPLFALTAFTGLIDGLVRRDIRKFGAGRESSYLYHKARGTLVPIVVLPWTLYLALPISVSPLLVLLPCAVLLGLSVSITVASFKKYL